MLYVIYTLPVKSSVMRIFETSAFEKLDIQHVPLLSLTRQFEPVVGRNSSLSESFKL